VKEGIAGYVVGVRLDEDERLMRELVVLREVAALSQLVTLSGAAGVSTTTGRFWLIGASTVVDVLPVRTADAVAAWLAAHPGIEIISRDRHGPYADAGRRGAPQAVQVADRFHLVLNLRGAVQQELRRVRPVRSFSKGFEALVEAYP
jgi:transposase